MAVYDVDDELRAKLVREDSPGSGEAARIGATLKFHVDCYEAARAAEPTLPPRVRV